MNRPSAFAIKAEISNAASQTFAKAKTMYGGKLIQSGDAIFLFDIEKGLVAKGRVTDSRPTPRNPRLERQTPRISITVEIESRATKLLGRTEVKSFTDWKDGRPETEINFKFYRQSTPKIVGLTSGCAAFLSRRF